MLKTKMMLLLSILFLLNEPVAAEKKKFYFKAITALNKNSNIKTSEPDINFILNQEANLSPTVGFGLGYQINSFSRMDIVFENSNINFNTKAATFSYSENGISHYGVRTIKRAANIQSIMLNGYIDVINKRTYKIFVGSGVGIGYTRIKESSFDRFDSNIRFNGNIITLPTIFSSNINKNKNNFSYAFITGADFRICNDFNIELAYSWKDLGKVKVIDNIDNKYQGHNLSASLRFDL